MAVKLPKPEPMDRKSWFPVRRHTFTEYRAGTCGEKGRANRHVKRGGVGDGR